MNDLSTERHLGAQMAKGNSRFGRALWLDLSNC